MAPWPWPLAAQPQPLSARARADEEAVRPQRERRPLRRGMEEPAVQVIRDGVGDDPDLQLVGWSVLAEAAVGAAALDFRSLLLSYLRILLALVLFQTLLIC